MFLYQSLFDHEGNNLFWAPKEYHPAHLSDIGQHYVAGLLKYAPEFAMVTNPTVNSYKRLVNNGEVPVYATWGIKNRSALVRIPTHKPGKHNSTRVELRNPDPTANPYLALAATLAAGVRGIEEGLPLPKEMSGNYLDLSESEAAARGIARLPHTLGEAIERFEKSELMREALGEHIFEYLIAAKRREWNEYCTTVTDWERKRYYSGL
jgi:glutamine synthetase